MKVVICDDHRLLLESLAAALALKGCRVEAAVTTPPEAVRAVGLHAPDILLIDVAFPEGSGLDAARQVCAQHPRTKVVMITGEENPEHLREALEIGVCGYVRKGQRVDSIVEVLATVARGESAFDRDLLNGIRRSAPLPHREPQALDSLTPRERHVLQLLVAGRTTRQIVRQLEVSQSTVRTHVQNILAKLGVHSRLQAVALLAKESELSPGRSSHGNE